MIPILRRHICNTHRHYRSSLTALFNCSLVDTAASHTPRYHFASKVEHITCQFGLLKYKRHTHTTTILFNNNNNIDDNEDIIFTENFNKHNKVIVLSDQEFLSKTSKHTTTTSIHSLEDDDISTQTLIPETLKEDMLEFWDEEDDMLPLLKNGASSQTYGRRSRRRRS